MINTIKKLLNQVKESITPNQYRIICNQTRQFIANTVRPACSAANGLHAETYLSSLGALAGFACQMAVRDAIIKTGRSTENEAFVTVTTTTGDKYFFGDLLNFPLMHSPGAVTLIICKGVTEAGSMLYPQVNAIADYVAATVGSEAFGRLTVEEAHQPIISPRQSLDLFWPKLYPWFITHYSDDESRANMGLLIAQVIQRFIVEAKNIVQPPLAARIAIEAAMFMSKVDPDTIGVQARSTASSPKAGCH